MANKLVLTQEIIDKIYNKNKDVDKSIKNRPQSIGPLPQNYWEHKRPIEKRLKNTTLFRGDFSIPEKGRPYAPLSVCRHLTGYSVAFLGELHANEVLRGFKFPQCPVMVSVYDLLVYIDSLSATEIEGMEVSHGLKNRIRKAQRIKKQRALLMNDPEYKKRFDAGEACQRRLKPRRQGVKRPLKRKDGALV